MTNTILNTGLTVNANAIMQDHLNQGGKLELVIRSDGQTALEFLLPDTQVEQLKVELDIV